MVLLSCEAFFGSYEVGAYLCSSFTKYASSSPGGGLQRESSSRRTDGQENSPAPPEQRQVGGCIARLFVPRSPKQPGGAGALVFSLKQQQNFCLREGKVCVRVWGRWSVCLPTTTHGGVSETVGFFS